MFLTIPGLMNLISHVRLLLPFGLADNHIKGFLLLAMIGAGYLLILLQRPILHF
jgi:hypothetical protein